MLTIYRRHSEDCANSSDRYWRRCRCPVWAEGTVEGVYRRKTLKTRSWERATELARALEDGKKINQPDPLTIEKAVASFLVDAEQGRKLREPTLKKYRVVLAQLKTYAATQGVAFLKEIDVEFVRGFRGSWKDGAISGVKKLERTRAFFRFFVASGDVTTNPATAVKAPTPKHCPTLPLKDEEISAALKKADDPRWHALIQVLRWSGLRIGDAMKLTPEKFDGSRLFLRTAKTGTPVYVPLPPFVIDELKELPLYGGFYFWNRAGESHIDTTSGNARRALRRIFKDAKVIGAHPHRFRDSFAVGLLESGAPLETVSVLLGHSSIRITERHYAPWVASLQANLEKSVAQTWPKAKLSIVKKKKKA